MTETVEKTETGAILYDKAIINQIGNDRFAPRGWPHAEPVTGNFGSGGRGNTMYVGNVPKQFVLRHFRRGGLLGKLVRDTYIFSGEDKTRAFREWRLLDKLAANNLNVPRPAAARYCRRGTFYTCDIITVRIPGVVPLSEYLSAAKREVEFWQSLGAALWKFHAAGVYHADMNAFNVQIDTDGDLWLLDFDKGEVRAPGVWQQETLSRLHRSLEKVLGLNPALNYSGADWEQLLDGYFNASRSA